MAEQYVDLIQVGRSNADKINSNFDELYALVAGFGRGKLISYTAPAGQSNNVFPATFDATVGRLDVTLTANANFTGFQAGSDGQFLFVRVAAGNFFLTLNVLNAGSNALNQFDGASDIIIPLKNVVLLFYYGGNVGKWVIVP